ncbi:MAG: YfjI family protein [Phycisphaerales bacterium]
MTTDDDGEDDPVILPLDDAEELPEILPVVLPEWAAKYAIELSRAKEVSPTLATLLMLPVIASTCQRAYVVEIEGSYTEPLCLYASPALDSGERKTAIHGPIVKPIFEFQGQLRREAKDAAAEAEIKHRLAEKQIKNLEREMPDIQVMGDKAELDRIQKEIISITLANPKPAGLPQLVMQDFTDAALGVALSENGESLLVTSDEGGLFDNLAGRFNDVAEIDLFLQSHTGSAHTVNRTGRDNIFLERPLLSVAVSPQPGVLVKLGAKPGFAERGLLARFLWALPRSSVGGRALEPAQILSTVKEAYHNRLTVLAKRGYAREVVEPIRLRLTSDAYRSWKEFELSLEPRMGKVGDLRSIKSWASKLPGAVARIAAVCHVADQFAPLETEHRISAGQMQRAIETGRLLIPHAMAAHRLMLGGGRTVAADVVQHFNTQGWPREAKSQSEWWRQVRRYVGESSANFTAVAQVLLDHGYLIEVEHPGTYRTGRPGKYFRANRRLWAGSAG